MTDVPAGHSAFLDSRERYFNQPGSANHLSLRNGSSPSQLPAPDLSQQQRQEQSQSQSQQQSNSSQNSSTPTLSEITSDLHTRISSFLSETHDPTSLLFRVQEQTRISLRVIREALSRYPLSDLSLSYNGGKDCLVLLILFLASLHPLPSFENGGPSSIPSIYAQPRHPFQSVEEFVSETSEYYHLSLMRYPTDPPRSTLKSTFSAYLDKNPNIKAIFVGTRRTDPHGEKLTHFDRTDHGWPDFVRIHPVIDWHYVEIWAFIRHLDVKYCPLYDQGYTSLGGTNDTHPNPKLRVSKLKKISPVDVTNAVEGTQSPEQSPVYRPAYELIDDEEERLGRR